MSRTVNGEWLFDDVAREILRRQIWQVANYCGVQIVTYTIMSNHFHVLVRVPRQQDVSDVELLRRFHVLYPKPTAYQAARLDVIQAELAANGPEAVAWRRRQLALMGDVSPFMKLVKQRFSIWFNKSHHRFGTLWAERFKSLLIEAEEKYLQTAAAYIDLNCVRAGMVNDPKDYRFCGYAEAVAGRAPAQEGICIASTGCGWKDAQAHYREVLFGTGASPRDGAATIPSADFQRVLSEGGRVPLTVALRCRLRFFTDGAILGSKAFVEVQTLKYHEKSGGGRLRPHTISGVVEWDNWTTLRGLRRHAAM